MKLNFFITSNGTSYERKSIYLTDMLRTARTSTWRVNYVNIQRVPINRDSRPSIFQHPPSQIKFKPIKLGKIPKLLFACSIKQKIWPKLTHSIIFKIQIQEVFGKSTCIFQEEVSPSDLYEKSWLNHEIDLSAYGEKNIRLIFSTSTPKGKGTYYCWSVWGNPRIEHDLPTSPKYSQKPKLSHILLITADALRPDHIGAYGNTEVQTPHINALATDGILFNHSRAQTSTTLGSYASLLLSQHPKVHSINGESGAIKKGLPSFPNCLSKNGYNTIVVPSEMELADPRTGLTSLFAECVPCLGEPVQDGSITTRISRDLFMAQKKPTFFWLQYFDTHPPVIPPSPYHSMYYSGNPESETNSYRPESVKSIYGTEAMQQIAICLPYLKQGFIDGIFIDKLASTVAALQGAEASEPDLAIHIRNLGTKAQNNMSQRQFTKWLDKQVLQLKAGNVPQALLQWLEDIFPMLQEINDDITTWLNRVVDFRYPLAQYKAGVSYFDSQLGKLFSFLKENDLYENSLIVVTSPHGEILDEHGIHFHHHTLTESCLRIPMIIKPPQTTSEFKPGTRIDGIFDSIDFLPTILELMGLKPPLQISGSSRASNIKTGSPILDHDSYAINIAYTLASITHGNYKYMKAVKDYLNSEKWRWHKGDEILIDLRDTPVDTINRIGEFPDLANEMRHRLNLFLEDDIK